MGRAEFELGRLFWAHHEIAILVAALGMSVCVGLLVWLRWKTTAASATATVVAVLLLLGILGSPVAVAAVALHARHHCDSIDTAGRFDAEGCGIVYSRD